MIIRTLIAPLSVVASFAIAACSVSTATPETASTTAEALIGSKCDVASDCHGILPDICEKCSDGSSACDHFVCTDDKCATEICPPAPPPPATCETASQCKGPLPKLCEVCSDGKTACAHFVCESGSCDMQICPPVHECKKASDCHGVLPDLCEKCSDGKDACAHFVCDSGKCETAICPK